MISIDQIILEKGLGISTEKLNEINVMKEGHPIEFIDLLDTQKKLITLQANEYLQDNDYIYVKTQDSNCILTLKLSESKKPIDIATRNEVGRLINSSYDDNILGPYLGPQS